MQTDLIEKGKNNDLIVDDMYDEISSIILNNKNKMIYQINNTLVETNFMIGKVIVENEQNGNIRAEYGKEILMKLSKKLTNKFGGGFSRSNLQNMRLFYNKYKKCQTATGKFKQCNEILSWSHYCYLIYIEDDDERRFYEKECINEKWSVRELKRQIDSSLFQRLLLSDGKANKQKVLELSKKGQTMEYALGGLSNNIFASTYIYYIPNKEELINEVEKVLESNK